MHMIDMRKSDVHGIYMCMLVNINALVSASPVRFCTLASLILRHVAAGCRIQAARGQAEGECRSPPPAGRPAKNDQFRSSFWLVGMTDVV